MIKHVQPVYCSFAADVICQTFGCANGWRAYMPEGCEDVNVLKLECPQCHADSGTPITWWPADVPKDLLPADPHEGE